MKGYYKEILESGEYRGFKITKDINFPLGERFFAEHPNEEFVKTDSCLEGLIDDINEWHEDQLEEEIKLLKAENAALQKQVRILEGRLSNYLFKCNNCGNEHGVLNTAKIEVCINEEHRYIEGVVCAKCNSLVDVELFD